MIAAQAKYSESIEQRYRRLAGPFDADTESLFDGLCRYLTETGARIVTVDETEGICVWRLRSECETLEETQKRLAQYKRTKKH